MGTKSGGRTRYSETSISNTIGREKTSWARKSTSVQRYMTPEILSPRLDCLLTVPLVYNADAQNNVDLHPWDGPKGEVKRTHEPFMICHHHLPTPNTTSSSPYPKQTGKGWHPATSSSTPPSPSFVLNPHPEEFSILHLVHTGKPGLQLCFLPAKC